MRVFAPSAFRYNGTDYPYGWQDLPESLAYTLLAAGNVNQNDSVVDKNLLAADSGLWGLHGGAIAPINAEPLTVLQSFASSTKNLTVFLAALAANSCKVAHVGHSIVNGANQNWYGATVYNLLRRYLKQAFPTVAFTFENFGIGGTTAGQFVSGNPNTTIAAPSNNTYRENWQTVSGALTTNGSWRNAVAAYLADIIFIQWDLNETDSSAFATSLQGIIDDINSNAAWVAKRPSIVLVASHTGMGSSPAIKEVIRQCHRALRSLAQKNAIPILDAGRVYEVVTTGIDPSGIGNVTGEQGFRYNVPSGSTFTLNPAYWDNKIGTAYSPTGTTVRDQSSGAIKTLRKRLTLNGAVQAEVTTNSVNGTPSLYYRVDPTDANYGTDTGKQYEIRITGTTVQAYFRPSGGSATAISGAAATLTNGAGASTKFQMRVEYVDGWHKVTVIAPTGEVKTFEFYDFQYLGAGYVGVGVGGSSGFGFFGVGSGGGNLSNGLIFEFWDQPKIGMPVYRETDLIGAVNDWSTNVDSAGGNAVNHLTNRGYKLIYEPAIFSVIRQLQAA